MTLALMTHTLFSSTQTVPFDRTCVGLPCGCCLAEKNQRSATATLLLTPIVLWPSIHQGYRGFQHSHRQLQVVSRLSGVEEQIGVSKSWDF